jgi:small subunit ribosomal protein S6
VRSYELLYILHPSVDEEGLNSVADRVQQFIARSGGKVIAVDPWGSRRLAYPIQNQQEGQYVLVRFDLPADQVASVEHDVALTEEIMRHLIVRHEEEAKARADDV